MKRLLTGWKSSVGMGIVWPWPIVQSGFILWHSLYLTTTLPDTPGLHDIVVQYHDCHTFSEGERGVVLTQCERHT